MYFRTSDVVSSDRPIITNARLTPFWIFPRPAAGRAGLRDKLGGISVFIEGFGSPERKWLRAIIHEGDAEAVVKEKQEKALAEHVARHPEDVGRTVEDFKWIMHVIVRMPIMKG